MEVALQQFLRLPRLPFRHFGLHIFGAEAQSRTGDTRIFSPLLYQLSYLGTSNIVAVNNMSVKGFPALGMMALIRE